LGSMSPVFRLEALPTDNCISARQFVTIRNAVQDNFRLTTRRTINIYYDRPTDRPPTAADIVTIYHTFRTYAELLVIGTMQTTKTFPQLNLSKITLLYDIIRIINVCFYRGSRLVITLSYMFKRRRLVLTTLGGSIPRDW